VPDLFLLVRPVRVLAIEKPLHHILSSTYM
jgi:hypothetical protein